MRHHSAPGPIHVMVRLRLPGPLTAESAIGIRVFKDTVSVVVQADNVGLA